MSEINRFEYNKLTEDEQLSRGILGRLVGKIASWKEPTRNGRKYDKTLWERIFKDPIFQEKINNRVCFGELCHPFSDREEVDPEKIAICLAETPTLGDDGFVYGVFDILSTPCGKILKTLCDYGTTVGVSSRGSGDLITDYDGNEAVDPETYDCVGWDAVLIPAVKEARLQYVTESLNTNKPSLQESLNKLVEEANDEDKKIMQETINNLDMNKDGIINNEDILMNEDLADDFRRVHDEDEHLWNLHNTDYSFIYDTLAKYGDIEKEGIDGVFRKMPDEEQKALTRKLLEPYIKQGKFIEIANEGLEDHDKAFNELYDKLGADQFINELIMFLDKNDLYDTFIANKVKEHNIQEDVNHSAVDDDKADVNIINLLQEALSEKADLEGKVVELQEKLSVCYAKEAKNDSETMRLRSAISNLSQDAKKVKALEEKVSTLTEQLEGSKEKLAKGAQEIKNLNTKLNDIVTKSNKINEAYKSNVSKYNTDTKSLNESLADAKKDLQLKTSEYSKKLEKSNQLVEKYKGIASAAVSRYMSSQAVRLGVTVEEIKNRLPESYSFDDIDNVCESLQSYKLSLNRLPFRTSSLTENMKMEVKSSKKENIIPANGFDDDIDDGLMSLAGMNR